MVGANDPSGERVSAAKGGPEEAEKDAQESEPPVVPMRTVNPPQGSRRREGVAGVHELLEGKMQGKSGPDSISTRLRKVAELARCEPPMVLTTLAHHIDLEWLREAYRRTRKDGAVGADGQSGREYEVDLDRNLGDLLERFKSGSYFAPPVKRVHIPKGDGGKTRPIGVPTFEDKVLQRAVAMMVEAVYEQDFLDCSYGFRPGRSAHDALQALWKGLMGMGGGWVLELDIASFFDELSHPHLRQILDQRVRDGVLRRAIDKWLKAGVMEGGEVCHPTAGTPQGGVISPLLANIYLHEVLDAWFEDVVKPRMEGRAVLVRYADDAVMVFALEGDARKVLEVLPKRFGRYGLRLHPEKTRLVQFRRPRDGSERGGGGDVRPGSFDLLGFTHYWGKSRKGSWVVKRKTAKSRFRRALKSIAQWCRRARHERLTDQHRMLETKLRGHYNYYGITGNLPALTRLKYLVGRVWRKWLSRRSQKGRISWERFNRLLRVFPLPPPRIVHSFYAGTARP